MKPLAIDLYCGLGGWTDGLLAEGWDVIGFDIERHCYPAVRGCDSGVKRPGLNWSDRSKRGSKDAQFNRPAEIEPDAEWLVYPGQLVIQDVLTLHGSQFRDADLIVASPPCQGYSYRAMPWSRAKALPPPDNSLFDACFRIQREACEAAGRHIPLIVENVRGAQKWVGRSRWNFGSFHLWGDVPALMPMTARRSKMPGASLDRNRSEAGIWGPHHSRAVNSAIKNSGGSWFNIGSPGQKECNRNLVAKPEQFSREDGGKSFDRAPGEGMSKTRLAAMGSKSNARKAASAMIAKIPLPLSTYIARTFYPQEMAA